MILNIDTKDRKKITVSLCDTQGNLLKSLSEENKYGSQVLLPLISKLLDREKMIFQDLSGIEVEKGPGSFTGIRVGVSVANALGFSLGIPVNAKKMSKSSRYAMETDLLY